MAEIVFKGLLIFLDITSIVVALAIPCLYVYHTGRLGRGILYSWLALIGFTILMSLIVPGLLTYVFPDRIEMIYKHFPESRGIGGAICVGWFIAVIFCGAAKFVHNKRKKSISS